MRLEKYIDEMCDAKHNSKKKKKKIDEGYTENELGRLDKDIMINAQFKDGDGKSTKWLGLNDKEALTSLKKFLDWRLKNINLIKKKMGY